MHAPESYVTHKLQNLFHSVLLVGAMLILLGVLGLSLWGRDGLFMLVVLGGGLFLFSPRASPRLLLRMYRARRLHPAEARGLHEIVAQLSHRAALPAVPPLFYLPTPMANAFTLGHGPRAVIGVTDGLLRQLDARQIAGVLAHEISHIRNNDLVVMAIADTLSRLTRMLSWMGQILLFVFLPLVLLGQALFPFTTIILLLFAPMLAALLQLALSRTREFDADLSAARLTGDPRGLASALAQLEKLQRGGWFARIFFPERGNPDPSLLRTHPTTEERIERLLELERAARHRHVGVSEESLGPIAHVVDIPHLTSPRPRWRITGLWY